MGWLTRAIVVLVVVWALWKLLRGVLEGAGLLEQGSPRARGVKLERDPVCGVFVAPATALVARARGETAYFCSEQCRQRWEKGR